VTYPTKLPLAILAWWCGLFVLPIILLFTPRGATRLRWLDGIYGNKYDGLDGDAGYQARVRVFRRYRWLALRNPVNNLLRRFGPNGTLQRVVERRYGVDYWVDGRRYWYRQYPLVGRIHWIAGCPPWDDWRPQVRSEFRVGRHFEQRMLIWPFKAL